MTRAAAMALGIGACALLGAPGCVRVEFDLCNNATPHPDCASDGGRIDGQVRHDGSVEGGAGDDGSLDGARSDRAIPSDAPWRDGSGGGDGTSGDADR